MTRKNTLTSKLLKKTDKCKVCCQYCHIATMLYNNTDKLQNLTFLPVIPFVGELKHLQDYFELNVFFLVTTWFFLQAVVKQLYKLRKTIQM